MLLFLPKAWGRGTVAPPPIPNGPVFTVRRGGEPQYIVPRQNVFLELRQKIQHKAGFLVRSTKVSQMKVK